MSSVKETKKDATGKKKKASWTADRFVLFLNGLRPYNPLWEVTHEKYKDSQLKQVLWKKVYNAWPSEDREKDPIITIAELKSHLKNVRKILKDKTKMQQQVFRSKFGTGSGADVLEDALEDFNEEEIAEMKLPKWWDAAEYLRPHVEVREQFETIKKTKTNPASLNDLNMSSALSSVNDADPQLPSVNNLNESTISGSKSVNETHAEFTPTSRTFSSHRSHTIRPMSNAVKEAKEVFSEAVQALKMKRPCSTDEQDSFMMYIKRRMMKFNDSDRQALEDVIIDSIRKFERNMPSSIHSIYKSTAPQMPLVCRPTSLKDNVDVLDNTTENMECSTNVLTTDMNYSSLMYKNRPSSAINVTPKIPLAFLASTSMSSCNEEMVVNAAQKIVCNRSERENDVSIPNEEREYIINNSDYSSFMIEEEIDV